MYILECQAMTKSISAQLGSHLALAKWSPACCDMKQFTSGKMMRVTSSFGELHLLLQSLVTYILYWLKEVGDQVLAIFKLSLAEIARSSDE